jgi:hypothetical protein
MAEDYFRKILSQSKDNFKQINNPPTVIYNPKKKTVSVKYDFALGLIEKVKIIAPCNLWLDISGQNDKETICYEMIEPYLYRASRTKRSGLRQYSKNYPGSFLADILDCVKWSHTKNPLTSKGR